MESLITNIIMGVCLVIICTAVAAVILALYFTGWLIKSNEKDEEEENGKN